MIINQFINQSYGPPHMAKQKQDDQPELTYSSYVRTQDVTQKTCRRRWMIGRSGERWSRISVLAAQHDDDDDDDKPIWNNAKLSFMGKHSEKILPLKIFLVHWKTLVYIYIYIYLKWMLKIKNHKLILQLGVSWMSIYFGVSWMSIYFKTHTHTHTHIYI